MGERKSDEWLEDTRRSKHVREYAMRFGRHLKSTNNLV